DRYFADLAAKGYNMSQIAIGWDTFDPPFNQNDPTQPNTNHWNKVDWMFDAANAHGIYVEATVTWAQDYDTLFGGSSAQAYNLGRWLGQRYGTRNNVLWSICGEYSEITKGDNTLFSEMARGLNDTGATQIKTIEPGNPPYSSSGDFNGSTWLD